MLVTVNNRLKFEIEIVHDLSCHPIHVHSNIQGWIQVDSSSGTNCTTAAKHIGITFEGRPTPRQLFWDLITHQPTNLTLDLTTAISSQVQIF